MLNLATDGSEKPISIKKITEVESLSPIFLEQIFTKLKKSGLVVSIRGAGGGFLLARRPDEISIRDILEAVEEGINLTPCCADDEVAPKDCQINAGCRVTQFWNDANEHIMEYFAGISLAKVIEDYRIPPKIG